MKLLIEINMAGHDTVEDKREACISYVNEKMDTPAITTKILWVEDACQIDW